MKKYVLFLCVAVVFFSCKNEEKQIDTLINTYQTIDKLQWLVGEWTNISEASQSYENWSKINDSTLFSHSFTLVKKDTVFAEHVILQENGNNVLFTVTAYNQNDNKPVTFKMIPSKKDVFVFENPEHDFPSKISYSNPVTDSIHAWIEGEIKGETRKIDFRFIRN